ncbi:MAG: sulfatase-like hydrolase/transferase, partial [Bacteroidota bacterium]
SRYALMTGRNNYRSRSIRGVWNSYQQGAIAPADLTLGKVMQQGGYNTAFFGKWHLGSDFNRIDQPDVIYRRDVPVGEIEGNVDISRIVNRGPSFHGFDYSFLYPAGIQDVPYAVYENEQIIKLKPNSEIDSITYEYIQDRYDVELDKDQGLGDTEWNPFEMGPLLANKAVDYINDHAGTGTPFFFYYCSQAVHVPHTPADSLNGKKIKGSTLSNHMDMIAEFDAQMGLIVDALKAKGVFDNTLIIITSDNGGLNRRESSSVGHRSNSNLRGNKNTIFEGGHRVPFIVSWPDRVAKGSQYSGMINGQDILATIADAAGVAVPNTQAQDSYSFYPIITGDPNPPTRKLMVTQGGTSREVAFRDGNWKLIMSFGTGLDMSTLEATQLYDLTNDIGEQNNLISNAAHSERVQAMFNRYTEIRNGETPTKTLHDTEVAPVTPSLNNSDAPIGKTIWLRQYGGQQNYVSVQPDNIVRATASGVNGAAEQFIVELHPKGGIALRSVLTNKYLRSEGANTALPLKGTGGLGGWSPFIWKEKGVSKVAIYSRAAESWVHAPWNTDNALLFPNLSADMEASVFEWGEVSSGASTQVLADEPSESIAYPNPFSDEIHVDLNQYLGQTVTISLQDIGGMTIESKEVDVTATSTEASFSGEGITKLEKNATYFLTIKSKDTVRSVKLVK